MISIMKETAVGSSFPPAPIGGFGINPRKDMEKSKKYSDSSPLHIYPNKKRLKLSR